jgi:uncharacterized protein YrrD
MLRPFHTLQGATLAASDGDIGKIREFYFDDDQWIVRYLVIETGSWLAGRKVLITPRVLGEIDPQAVTVSVALSQEEVRRAPSIDTDKPVSREHEEQLHRHYDWNPYWPAADVASGTMLIPSALAPAPAFAPPPEFSQNLRPDAPPDPPEARGNPHLRSSAELLNGYTMHAQDGEIGVVQDFIIDDSDWRLCYLVIHTGMLFLGKDVLLAPRWIEAISANHAEIFVKLPRASIKEAPEYNSSVPLSHAFEQRLHDHYHHKEYSEAVESARKHVPDSTAP